MHPRLAQPASFAVADRRFVLDGRARFLLGVSLFDALGATPPGEADLDALQAWGISIIRVWAHWSEPIYAPDGSLSSAGRARLLAFARRLDARGFVFELVLLRPGQLPGQPYAAFSSAATRRRAVGAVAREMRPFPRVLFDLCNEHDHRDGPITHEEGRALRDEVKAADPARLVTISSTEYHVFTPKGDIGAEGRQMLAAEVGRGPGSVAVDVVAVHLPRTEDWAASTGRRVRRLESALQTIGFTGPAYLSEEDRAYGPARTIAAADYLTAAREARRAGAAGWVLHTSAGFALGRTPFLQGLNPEERAALDRLRTEVDR